MVLVGRYEILNEVGLALRYPGRESQSTVLIGGRGCGKTVLLNRLQIDAAEHGWVWIQDDGRAGLPERLHARAGRVLAKLAAPGPRRRLTHVDIAGIGSASWEQVGEREERPAGDLRDVLDGLLDRLAEGVAVGERPPGLLITVDELHVASLDELNAVGNVYQHLVRGDRPILFVGAGLPGPALDKLLNDPLGPSFLHRSYRPSVEQLEHLDDVDVADGLRAIAAVGGRSFADDAVDLAADVIEGFPYMLQSVGHEAWRACPGGPVIGIDDVQRGLPAARRRLARNIAELATRGISGVDLQFLEAMALDPQGHDSAVSDIASRLAISGSYVGRYRDRLIASGMIRATGYGRVEFVVRGLRDHLTDHPTTSPSGVEQDVRRPNTEH